MEKGTLITAQNTQLDPCAPCSFKSEVLWHLAEAEGDGRRHDRSLLCNQYVFGMCIVLRVLFSSRCASGNGALTRWGAAWEVSDDGQAEQKPREKKSPTIEAWLHGKTTIRGTATRTPAFGFCDKMPDGEWTCERRPIPNSAFSTVKAEYQARE
jgi:hypothetical protein